MSSKKILKHVDIEQLASTASVNARKFLQNNPTSQNRSVYVLSDSAFPISEYSSMISSYDYERDENLQKKRVLIGIELPEYPKLPNGKSYTWWYDIQLNSCQTCIFLNGNKETSRWQCENPKISKHQFAMFVENLGECPEFLCGASPDRIEEYKITSAKGLQYCMAALTKLGLAENNDGTPLPQVGSVKIFKYDKSAALWADRWNKSVYYYMQNYIMNQSKNSFDFKNIKNIPFQEVPEVEGEEYMPKKIPYENQMMTSTQDDNQENPQESGM